MLGVIGSEELLDDPVLGCQRARTLPSEHGPVDAVQALAGGVEVLLLRRGGRCGTAAHAINHRANIDALARAGVTQVVSTAMVGSLRRTLPVGSLLVLDQFLDFMRSTPRSYYTDDVFRDFDFTEPFCPVERVALLEAAGRCGVRVRRAGCYVGVDGPRFETRSEVRMFGRLGGDVIGMTLVPEATMARERGLCYVSVAAVVNLGAGLAPAGLTAESMRPARRQAGTRIRRILAEYVRARTSPGDRLRETGAGHHPCPVAVGPRRPAGPLPVGTAG
jgi:5'-methylthioadenosine phosphorylase